MRAAFRRIAFVLIACSSATLCGCASMRVVEEQKPVSETTLMVTRSGGQATLSWETRPGFEYVLLYTDSRGPRSQWYAVRGAERVIGTGSMVTRTDSAPEGQMRYYRLKLLKAGSRSPGTR